MYSVLAVILYFSIITIIAVASYAKKSEVADFIMGGRSMNYWLTAISAHASDMSSWLFMGFPAAIFTFGPFKAWIAVGLLLFMYLNWQFIAPKIRIATGDANCFTFFSYLETRFHDKYLRLYCTVICFIFYGVYIAAGLVGMGLLMEEVYGITYGVALLGSVGVVLLCVLMGGYKTLAWIDLFQGCFLLIVIVFVPTYIFMQLGGWNVLRELIELQGNRCTMLPDTSPSTFFEIAIMVLGWGLGYFGQPAIITKFMGIKNVNEIHRSKYIGMIWMFFALFAAVFVGLVAIGFFRGGIANPEMIFIEMVTASFHPFVVGLIICAVFAATINVVSSQMLVIGSSFLEDIYRRFNFNNVSSNTALLITKFAICIMSFFALGIAYFASSSIYKLVLYAWSGLGSAFGPVLIFSLYSKKTNKHIAWAGVIAGSGSSAIWPWMEASLQSGIDAMVIGFSLSFLAIGITAYLEREKKAICFQN